MDKVTYALDTIAALPGADLTVARHSLAATGARANALPLTIDSANRFSDETASLSTGYFGGGMDSGFNNLSTMDKVTYSTDTTAAAPGANLSVARVYLAATGNSTAGYFGGGSPGPTSLMDKVTYSTDLTAALPSTGALSVGRSHIAATGNSTAGYFGGGPGSPYRMSTMDKITYSTDTTSYVPGANLTVARAELAASSARANGLSQPIAAVLNNV